MADFIEVYPRMLDAPSCRRIIEQFESSSQAVRGRIGSGIDTRLKDSFDITISGRPEWQPVEATLQHATLVGLRRYVRTYPYLLIGALAARLPDPATGQLTLVDASMLNLLDDANLGGMLATAFRFGSINLQKYRDGVGGYPHWHSEIYPLDPQAETLHRVLLFTIYLNDVPQGGETEFAFQQRSIRPEAGSLLLAPAGFTHTHRGNTPYGSDKYIATSWILFQRAERLYATPPPP
jgi:hypothetical protein